MENEYNKKYEKLNNMENRAQKNQYSNFKGKGCKKSLVSGPSSLVFNTPNGVASGMSMRV